VTVFWDDFHHLQSAWDTHNWHFPKMRNLLCPGLDQTYTALLEDLETRGLLDETAVVCMSEHGRTPQIDSGPRIHGGGRGHWAQAYSAILAGGGFARGKVVGKTDRTGGEVADTPISPKDILATIYHLLGIDPHTMIPDRLGRPLPVAGEGCVRAELLG
jgi:arylsulfatase A-like enzyme